MRQAQEGICFYLHDVQEDENHKEQKNYGRSDLRRIQVKSPLTAKTWAQVDAIHEVLELP